MDVPLLEIRNATKMFAKVVANKRVSFSVRRGEIVALLGENGAGKSTIMKIVYGLYEADSGAILVDGLARRIASPKDAMALGISMIQQHFSLVEAHSVAENVVLGSPSFAHDPRKAQAEVARLCAEHGFDVDPRALVRNLPVGVKQKVEILKAIHQKARLLIMDEPTAVLTPQEAESLMRFVRSWSAAGNSAIFITHKLKEVMDVADRIIVMRNGMVSGDVLRGGTDERALSALMIGRDLPPLPSSRPRPRRDRELLRLDGVSLAGGAGGTVLADVSFSVAEGEILGIAGVSGNGQQELCEIVCGERRPTSGTVLLDGERIDRLDIRARIDRGIGYVPSDRHRDAMAADLSLSENLILKSSFGPLFRKAAFLDRSRMAAYAASKIGDYSIKAGGGEVPIRELSGGNQQKVIVAREVDVGRRLIVFDQPTRGLDLGAIDYVHTSILREREKGKGILLISTELSEIFALSDRVAVLYRGTVRGIFATAELTAERIGLMMAGYAPDAGLGEARP